MTFGRVLAALVLLALAAALANAQHGSSSGGPFTAPPSSGAVSRGHSAARQASMAVPPAGYRTQPGRIVFAHQPFAAPVASSRLGLESAPVFAGRIASLRPGSAVERRSFLGRGFGFRPERRPFPHFPYFFFGGGPSACSPLLPGFFGAPWFDRQFTCFGTPFFGVDFYPRGFLAPELAFEPWLPGLAMLGEQQMDLVADGALEAGNLDLIASIAARESAESNPGQQVTTLVLKEGISFGVIDYWVDGDKLGYVTTYGIEKTIDLDRLDLDKTVKLNSSRGIPFVLNERSVPSTPPR
jgi:hypothetical protein